MFKKFQMLKKGVETIKKVAPKVGTKKSDQIKKSNRMLKDLDKTMKKDLSPRLKSEGEKLKKEIEKTRKEIYKSKMALGGMLGFKKKDKKKEKEKKDSEKGTKPKDLIYKPNKMKRLEELRKELKAKGGRAGEAQRRAGPAGLGALGGVRNKETKKSPDKKKRRESTEFEKVRFKLADKKMGEMSESDRKAIKNMTGKTASKVLKGIVTRKFKEAGNEAASAMGAYKRGGRAFGGGKR